MIPPEERARLRSFGDAAPGMGRVLDELEAVERERDALRQVVLEQLGKYGGGSGPFSIPIGAYNALRDAAGMA